MIPNMRCTTCGSTPSGQGRGYWILQKDEKIGTLTERMYTAPPDEYFCSATCDTIKWYREGLRQRAQPVVNEEP